VPDADRWVAVERIYHDAVDRPLSERAAFLPSACAGDDALRHEVESLLASDGSFLDRSAMGVAAREMAQQATLSWVGRTIRNYEILALLTSRPPLLQAPSARRRRDFLPTAASLRSRRTTAA
jgi:hypothetical protein